MYRQGDVLLIEVSQITEVAKPTDNIIAYGEYSGHQHVAYNCEVLAAESTNYIIAKTGAVLSHEKQGVLAEHQPISLPEGIYKVVMQKQYDPIVGWKNVID